MQISEIYTTKQMVRFWKKVAVADPTECWLWTAMKFDNGYGKIKIKGKRVLAHRFSWMLHNGAIKDGLCVLHKCDVRDCVNPSHLFLGTKVDNIADMCSKGRQSKGDTHFSRTKPDRLARGERNGSKTKPERVCRGETHGCAILKESQVIEMRRRKASGESCAKISRDFNASYQSTWMAVTGVSWAHLPNAQ